jgi:signal transduction histidine kinase
VSAAEAVAPPRATAPIRLAAVLLLLTYIAVGAGVTAVLSDVNQTAPFPILALIFAAYPLMGALILWQRGSHLVGWLMATIGIFIMLMIGSGDYAVFAVLNHPGSLPFGQAAIVVNDSLWAVGILLFACLLPMTFPTGRLLSRRWLIVVGLVVLYSLLAGTAKGLMPGPHIDGYPTLQNPIGWTGHQAMLTHIADFSILPGGAGLLGVIASVAVRYRRSRGIERQQLKWFLFTACFIPIPLLFGGQSAIGNFAFVIVLPMLAITIGLAVLRYGLYDIELVISRTLVYGALAAFITAVYVGIVVGVGTLVGSGGRPNLVLSIVATAVVAVAFQPVRERLQKVANRLVYGRRASPYEVLSEFSARVAESYAGEQVLPRMARVLAEATGAEAAGVWLRSGNSLRPAASWPEGTNGHNGPVELTGQLLPEIPETDRVVSVRHQGELLGALSVQKRPGESLTPIEEKLLDDLAHQAGLVLKNVGLTSDLQARLEELRASRQRLVKAQDDERRKLERNLHDGAQQHLVALKVKLGLAEALLAKDPARGRATIEQLKADADEALQTLRDLARGIYPPLLAERGLVAAIEAQSRKATVPVEVRADGVGRHPQEIEAAVYFCCLEALQNVQKYASAARATIRLTEGHGELGFEVEDDGVGFDPVRAKRGSGLINMSDRLDALGGSLRLDAAPGRGSLVAGRLPVPVANGGERTPLAVAAG